MAKHIIYNKYANIIHRREGINANAENSLKHMYEYIDIRNTEENGNLSSPIFLLQLILLELTWNVCCLLIHANR